MITATLKVLIAAPESEPMKIAEHLESLTNVVEAQVIAIEPGDTIEDREDE